MKEHWISGRFARGVWMAAVIIGLATATPAAFTRPDSEESLITSAYSGREYLRYYISWLGTIRAGILEMEIEPTPPEKDRYLIRVTVRSTGLVHLLYPVKDSFELIVEGRERLPVSMRQNDSGRQNQRWTAYDQKALQVSYSKNGEPPVYYPVDGPVHNEFSSFLILRTLPLLSGVDLMIPTFADKKRHEVVINIEGKEQRQCVLGDIATVKLQPQLTFQGLYHKIGNPLIWLTNDANRIPVRIEAKIKIGSLTAELAEYRRS